MRCECGEIAVVNSKTGELLWCQRCYEERLDEQISKLERGEG